MAAIDLLATVVKERRLAEALAPYLDRVEVESGGILIAQGRTVRRHLFHRGGACGGDADRLEADSPETLIRFHHGMAAILADRLAGANRLFRLLAD